MKPLAFHIDVLIPIPYRSVPFLATLDALRSQSPHILQVYAIEGRSEDVSLPKIERIVRNRNRMKEYGTAPFVFCLDWDVVIPPHSLDALAQPLWEEAGLGAYGLRYQKDFLHPSFGAMLFRRSVFQEITFRAGLEGCECYALRDDLKSMGAHMAHHPSLQAEHLRDRITTGHATSWKEWEKTKDHAH